MNENTKFSDVVATKFSLKGYDLLSTKDLALNPHMILRISGWKVEDNGSM
jgi:hypothetical protein